MLQAEPSVLAQSGISTSEQAIELPSEEMVQYVSAKLSSLLSE